MLRRALAAGIPGIDVTVVDVDGAKAEVCERLGVRFASPEDAPRERDIIIDTSGSDAGLQLAIELREDRGRDHRGQLVRRPRGAASASAASSTRGD